MRISRDGTNDGVTLVDGVGSDISSASFSTFSRQSVNRRIGDSVLASLLFFFFFSKKRFFVSANNRGKKMREGKGG